MAITGQTLTNSFVVAGQKFYAADFLVLIAELQALNDELVSEAIANAGNQAVGGVKTFSSAPVFSAGAACGSNKLTAVKDPTADQDAATMKHVADQFATVAAGANDSNGSYTFTGGFILKWGKSTLDGATPTAITFGTAFPNACFQAIVCGGTNRTDTADLKTSSITETGFTITHPNAETIGRWFAVGR